MTVYLNEIIQYSRKPRSETQHGSETLPCPTTSGHIPGSRFQDINLHHIQSNYPKGIGSKPPVEPALSKSFNIIHLLLLGTQINISCRHKRPTMNQVLEEVFKVVDEEYHSPRRPNSVASVHGLVCNCFASVLFTRIWPFRKNNLVLHSHCTKSHRVLSQQEAGMPLYPRITTHRPIRAILRL